MKSKAVFGALLVSVALCSQGFGLELLDRMLGLKGCGCNPCAPACCEEAQACEPACCEQAACEPACCEKAACEPACCEEACEPCCRKRCDLFKGLRDLADRSRCRRACRQACREKCCEPACCEEACCPEPACCEEACAPACCAAPACGGGAPVVAPAEEAAPLPQAPQADPSASLMRHRGFVIN